MILNKILKECVGKGERMRHMYVSPPRDDPHPHPTLLLRKKGEREEGRKHESHTKSREAYNKLGG